MRVLLLAFSVTGCVLSTTPPATRVSYVPAAPPPAPPTAAPVELWNPPPGSVSEFCRGETDVFVNQRGQVAGVPSEAAMNERALKDAWMSCARRLELMRQMNADDAAEREVSALVAKADANERARNAAATQEVPLQDVQEDEAPAPRKPRRRISARPAGAAPPRDVRSLTSDQLRQVEEAACGPAPEISYGGEQYDIAVWLEHAAPALGDLEVRDCTKPMMGIKHCWVLTCSVHAKDGRRGPPVQTTFTKSIIGFEVVKRSNLEAVQADLTARANRR